jgi:hypothetical protein
MWRRMGLIITDISEQVVAYVFRVRFCLLVTANVVSMSLIYSTLKMEATSSSSTSVITRLTRCHITED